MLRFVNALRRNHAHYRLAVRTAEALVAIHGQVGVERAYAEANRAAENPAVDPEERGHLNLVAQLARVRFLELEATAPEKRCHVYMRWLCRKGQLISGLLAEAR
jgi:hypothetical protein